MRGRDSCHSRFQVDMCISELGKLFVSLYLSKDTVQPATSWHTINRLLLVLLLSWTALTSGASWLQSFLWFLVKQCVSRWTAILHKWILLSAFSSSLVWESRLKAKVINQKYPPTPFVVWEGTKEGEATLMLNEALWVHLVLDPLSSWTVAELFLWKMQKNSWRCFLQRYWKGKGKSGQQSSKLATHPWIGPERNSHCL